MWARKSNERRHRQTDRDMQAGRQASWLAVWPADTHTKGRQTQTGGSEPSRFITEIDTEQRMKVGRNESK